MNEQLSLGVIGKSQKENEHRVPIHPEHMDMIPAEYRKKITFEAGYGERFGVTDDTIAAKFSGKVMEREELLHTNNCILLPKPILADLEQIPQDTVIWGWPHCVQQTDITQIAIDKRLTLIAWEEMFTWNPSGEKDMHIFYKNNEMAGYASVNHSLGLVGVTGHYGKTRKTIVISFGSVSRGAVYALQGQGFLDITVFTNRSPNAVKDQVPGITYKQMVTDADGLVYSLDANQAKKPFIEEALDAEIIVNGTLQDVKRPKMFISEEDSRRLSRGTLIIDISCDEGLGFWCAKPTSFEDPIIEEHGVYYYSVDHSPSYYWDSASWEISQALIPFIPTVMDNESAWGKNDVIRRCIEIKHGQVLNPNILAYQKRAPEYPHGIL